MAPRIQTLADLNKHIGAIEEYVKVREVDQCPVSVPQELTDLNRIRQDWSTFWNTPFHSRKAQAAIHRLMQRRVSDYLRLYVAPYMRQSNRI